MNRIHNFSAGPAILPISALEASSKAALELNGYGMSIMEMSHRSKEIVAIFDETTSRILNLMKVSSEDYSVLYLGGGASLQFAMVPYNFLKSSADYINTGTWADKAIKEAKLIGNTNVIASSKEANFNYIPKDYKITDDADYLHFTSNNTIFGTRYNEIPNANGKPLVCDMSSDIFSRNLDFNKFDLIYAGAQKNIGPSGVTLVVIKKSFLATAKNEGLTMLKYSTHTENDSMFNTPPVFPVFVINETLKWIEACGGLDAVEENNDHKAGLIYDAIDSSNGYYKGSVVHKEDRSTMNVTFNLNTPELEDKFIKEATAQNLSGLKGHRSVGGVRASIYNACPLESVKVLVDFMEKFKSANS